MSEVIEARGHPGRKSHESRASGREQCRGALLSFVFLSLISRLSLLLSFLLRGEASRRAELLAAPTREKRRGAKQAIAIGIAPRRLCTFIRFDPSRRLTLKQTLFMTRSLRNANLVMTRDIRLPAVCDLSSVYENEDEREKKGERGRKEDEKGRRSTRKL